jgi:peptidyl-tRNA hydrolase
MQNLVCYILVRVDIPSMRFGKGCAQAAHAANQFTDEHIIRPLLEGDRVDEAVMEWRTHANGFGTTITLETGSLRDMEAAVGAAEMLGFKAGLTVDPTYPYIVDREIFALIPPEVHIEPPVPLPDGTFVCFRVETTTGYIFGDKTKLEVLLKRFRLLNND